MALTRWNKEQFGNIQSNIKATRSALALAQQNLDSPRAVDHDRNLRCYLEHLLKMDETLWFQKSRLKWKLEGDRCTRFFFLSTLTRRKFNRIDHIKGDDGQWLTSRDQIGQAFLQRFLATYDELIHSEFDLHQLISPTISDVDNASLLKPLEHKSLPAYWVCNVIYKVISKLLVDRLKPLLTRLICPTQGAFVPDHSIHDNSIIIQEIIHAMKRKKGSKGWMGLKIDLQKAYDRLSWQFLEKILKAFGFHPVWVHRVITCISTARMTLMLNGAPVHNFSPRRGLHQGDPLSPYLFIFAMEVLSL
ncbi:hypothetical protein UlMin_025446 [Ulmus minor]